jgi:hypothetical protein
MLRANVLPGFVFMRPRYLALLFFVLMFCNGCFSTSQSEQTSIEYNEINQQLRFWEFDAETRIVTVSHMFSLKRNEPFSVYLRHNNGNIVTIFNQAVGTLSNVALPLMTPNEAIHWDLVIDKPESIVRVTPIVTIHLDKLQYTYQQLFIVLKDFNKLQGITSSLPTWLQHDFNRLWFIFDEPSRIFIKSHGNTTIVDTNENNHITLHLDDKLYELNSAVTFSTVPNSTLPLN